jgi:hypothetical protein
MSTGSWTVAGAKARFSELIDQAQSSCVAAVLWKMSLRDPGRHQPLAEPTVFQPPPAGRSCRAVVRSTCCLGGFFGAVSTGLSAGS